ncbi:MAG TPA: hypothetical protein VNW92_15165 [Polyangiaceae bacterium]|jgi:hypothetical protein|nr:hypothetical protein [Polyangiaceae bacterium]
MSSSEDDITEATRLDVFCARQGNAWRTYLRPGWQPRYLRQHFDDENEAFPAHFDFEDLDRHMLEHGAALETQGSTAGGVRLIARGRAAEALALWLAGVFGTGMRSRGSDPGETA